MCTLAHDMRVAYKQGFTEHMHGLSTHCPFFNYRMKAMVIKIIYTDDVYNARKRQSSWKLDWTRRVVVLKHDVAIEDLTSWVTKVFK